MNSTLIRSRSERPRASAQEPTFRGAEDWHPRVRRDRTALAKLQQVESAFERLVKKHLREYMSIVEQHLESLALASKDEAGVLVRSADREFDNEAFVNVLRKEYAKPLELGALFGAKDLPKGALIFQEDLLLRVNWSLLEPEVVAWLDEQAKGLVDGLLDTTRMRILAQVETGILAGESRDEIAARVKEVDKDIRDWRARQIAQTEVIKAHSQGALQVYKNSEVVQGKRWVDGQPNACPLCRSLNGQIVPLDDNFEGGVDAPPRHTGCRCTVAASLTAPESRAEARDVDVELLNSLEPPTEDMRLVAWTRAREELREKLGDTGAELKDIVDGYAGSFEKSKAFRERVEVRLGGGPADKRVDTLLSAMSKARPLSRDTYRGMAFSKDELASFVDKHAVGSQVDIALGSSSFRGAHAATFAINDPAKRPVVLVLRKPSGLNIMAISPTDEQEVLISGRFKVLSLEQKRFEFISNATVVELEQIGKFR